jgi:type IV secretory pathway VirB2 component (pilin)
MKYSKYLVPSVIILGVCLAPEFGFCTVESTLGAIQTRLTSTILPLASILGLVVAGLSFVAGSPNAKAHLWLAILGTAIGFGASSIMHFISEVVK